MPIDILEKSAYDIGVDEYVDSIENISYFEFTIRQVMKLTKF